MTQKEHIKILKQAKKDAEARVKTMANFPAVVARSQETIDLANQALAAYAAAA